MTNVGSMSDRAIKARGAIRDAVDKICDAGSYSATSTERAAHVEAKRLADLDVIQEAHRSGYIGVNGPEMSTEEYALRAIAERIKHRIVSTYTNSELAHD